MDTQARHHVCRAGVRMKSQKEVTLAEDLELRDRTDIYRNFLLYCMSGDVVALPMGAPAGPLKPKKSPQSAYRRGGPNVCPRLMSSRVSQALSYL